MESNLVKYELIFILPPNLGDNSLQKELDEVRDHVTSVGGDIYHEDIWGHRDLAFSIKKHNQGYYAVFNINYPPEKLKELEKALNIQQTVLRYLIIRIPNSYELKTMSEYKQEAEKEAEERDKAKKEAQAEKEKKQVVRRPVAAKIPSKPKPVAKPVKEEKPRMELKQEKAKMEDVDKKLKSIIDDPDISL